MVGIGRNGRALHVPAHVQAGSIGYPDLASPTTPVPHLRFDTFLSALGAARAGMGVLLGSLPLCAEDLSAGRLVRLGDDVLQHHESYWAIAGPDAVARDEWTNFRMRLGKNIGKF